MRRYEKQELLTAVSAIAIGLFIALFVLTVLLLMGGCTTTKYVPVETVTSRTDTVYSAKVRVDSVKVIERIYESDTRYDSIAPILDSLNNVIGWDRYHFRETTKKDEREMARLQSLVDSLRAVKQDTVVKCVPYPVERKLTKWEQTKMDFGGMFLGGMVVAVIAAVVIWIVKRKRRK